MLVDAGWCVDHDGVVSFTEVLAVGEITPADRRALLRVTDGWTPLTRGSPLSATTS